MYGARGRARTRGTSRRRNRRFAISRLCRRRFEGRDVPDWGVPLGVSLVQGGFDLAENVFLAAELARGVASRGVELLDIIVPVLGRPDLFDVDCVAEGGENTDARLSIPDGAGKPEVESLWLCQVGVLEEAHVHFVELCDVVFDLDFISSLLVPKFTEDYLRISQASLRPTRDAHSYLEVLEHMPPYQRLWSWYPREIYHSRSTRYRLALAPCS